MLFGIVFSDTLWDRLRAAIQRRLGKRVRNAYDVEDLTQESLLVAVRESDRVNSPQHLESFAHKVSRLQTANYARARRRAAQRSSPQAVDSVAVDGPPPEDVFRYQELLALIAEFARTLRPREKALLKLMVQGASGEEICQALGITPQARNVLAFRLRRKLKAKLQEKGYFPKDEG